MYTEIVLHHILKPPPSSIERDVLWSLYKHPGHVIIVQLKTFLNVAIEQGFPFYNQINRMLYIFWFGQVSFCYTRQYSLCQD